MATKNSSSYDESKIKTLSSLEHIRLRTGMYIGRLGDGSNQNDGIYVLLKEVIDNSVDEFIMGSGDRIVVHIEDLGADGGKGGSGGTAGSGGTPLRACSMARPVRFSCAHTLIRRAAPAGDSASMSC